VIFDRLTNADSYASLPTVREALNLIARFGGELPEGGYESADRGIRLSLLTIQTKLEADCRYEAHRHWLDIHYTLEGSELIKLRDVSQLKPLGEFDSEKDIGFYTGEAQAICRVKAGNFLVCFPQDAHMVCVAEGNPSNVRKIVAKIRIDDCF